MTERPLPQETTDFTQSREQDKRDPFIIRGHHSMQFANVLYKRFTPGEQAKLFRRKKEDILKATPDALKPSRAYERMYARDVLGDTPEEATRFEQFFKVFLERFLSLPPGYPVKLVENQKDDICKACTIGDHCTENTERIDLQFMNVFRKTAKKLGLMGDVSVTEETAMNSNAEPKTVQSVLTTADTAKKVFGNKRFINQIKYENIIDYILWHL